MATMICVSGTDDIASIVDRFRLSVGSNYVRQGEISTARVSFLSLCRKDIGSVAFDYPVCR